MIVCGCKLRPDNNVTTTAAAHFAGDFITKNIPAAITFRIQKTPDVQITDDSMYHISGSIEGYSSYNVPVSIEHFTETLHYIGGNPNVITSWDCVEIYIGKKKVK